MNKTYKLVEMAKANLKLPSDYAVSQLINVTRQMVSTWKSEASEANALNTMKLARAAGLTIEETIEILEDKEPKQKPLFNKQAGFIDVSLFFVTALFAWGLVVSTSSAAHCILC